DKAILVNPSLAESVRMGLLIADLNAILAGPSIYSVARFQGINLSSELQALVASNPTGEALYRMNRMLLVAAYPSIIAPDTATLPSVLPENPEGWLNDKLQAAILGNTITSNYQPGITGDSIRFAQPVAEPFVAVPGAGLTITASTASGQDANLLAQASLAVTG